MFAKKKSLWQTKKVFGKQKSLWHTTSKQNFVCQSKTLFAKQKIFCQTEKVFGKKKSVCQTEKVFGKKKSVCQTEKSVWQKEKCLAKRKVFAKQKTVFAKSMSNRKVFAKQKSVCQTKNGMQSLWPDRKVSVPNKKALEETLRQASGRMSAATEASQKATAWLGTNEVMDRVAAARRVGSSSARGTRTSSFAWTPSWPGPAHTKGSERLSRANAPNRTRTILSVPLEPTRHQASDSAQPTVPRSEEDTP